MTRQQLLNVKGINDKFSFGKYKGKTILNVLEENPSYLVWCIRNVKGFSIDPTLSEELCRQYDEHFEEYNRTQANGYTSGDIKALMRKYNMHATEAMNFLEYDVPEYF